MIISIVCKRVFPRILFAYYCECVKLFWANNRLTPYLSTLTPLPVTLRTESKQALSKFHDSHPKSPLSVDTCLASHNYFREQFSR